MRGRASHISFCEFGVHMLTEIVFDPTESKYKHRHLSLRLTNINELTA